MIIVLSDLHFSEAQSSQIGDRRFNQNLPVENFQGYFSEINQFAIANEVKKIDLVLAGDILEISRSLIWLKGDHRPYMDNDDVEPGSDAENTILSILNAIENEAKVAETLAMFRNLHDYFEMDVQLHLLLGNHDRLANATPKIRQVVRRMFGINSNGNDERIDNYLILKDLLNQPFCLIRHGHEYDRTNFSLDVSAMETIPTHIPAKVYDTACLGDVTTIEFGAALPWLFVRKYGESEISGDETLMALYQRLIEFDDVRPTTAWLAYLFSTPGVSKRKTWQLIKPLFTEILQTLSVHKEFYKTLIQSEAVSPAARFMLMALLRSGIFKKGVPYWLIKMIMKRVSGSIKLKSQVKWAKREALIQDKESGCKCIISGHSHFAEVSLISAKEKDERYYINTGTWRNVIPATKNYKNFGRLKALTKVMIFYPLEKSTRVNGKQWAFHYLSGVSFGDHRYL